MSGDDLEFGWVSVTFELSITGLYSDVILEELYEEDGYWDEYTRDDSIDSRELRYSRPQRFVDAIAYPKPDCHFKLFSHVPDDKKAYDLDQPFIKLNDTKIPSKDLVIPRLLFQIVENKSDEENLVNILGRGSICNPYTKVYVPKVTFDDIERIISQQDITIDVFLHVKCWHSLSSMSEPDLYLNSCQDGLGRTLRKNKDQAELANLSVRKIVKHRSRNEEGEDVFAALLREDSSEGPLTPEEQRRWLLALGARLASIQSAAWVIAIAVVVIVVTAFL